MKGKEEQEGIKRNVEGGNEWNWKVKKVEGGKERKKIKESGVRNAQSSHKHFEGTGSPLKEKDVEGKKNLSNAFYIKEREYL